MRWVTSTTITLLLLTPLITVAGITYQPLVGIPGVDNAASNFNQYINQLYFVSISIAALLAVIKIIIGGVKWMLTDVVTQKSDAKNDIRSALLGLLLIIAAFLILNTINPQLTNLNVLQSAPGVQLQQQSGRPAPVGVPGASPNNPTLTNNTVSQNERSQQIPGEVITRPPNGATTLTNTARIQAEQNCQRRAGFVLGYTVRDGNNNTRFLTSGSVSTNDIVSIHCTPPATP